jgi:peptidoglycan/LPS O-acetylase OafA/YrhL
LDKLKYPGLDIIRFIAALMVALFHLSYHSWLGAGPQQSTQMGDSLRDIGQFFTSGYVGVDTFFVLSGFVIAFSAHGKNAPSFLRSRIIRLYPAAWICATITLLTVFGSAGWEGRYIRSLSLWPAGPWVDQVYWTLAVEITFYALVFFLLALVGSKYLVALGYFIGGISSGFWLARSVDFVSGRHLSEVFSYLEVEIGNLLTSGCYFALGIMLWSFTIDGYRKKRILMALLCLVAGIIATEASARYRFISLGSPHRDLIVVPLVWLLSVFCIAASAHWNQRLSAGFSRLPLRSIGLATYPLYLVHEVFGEAVMRTSVAYLGAKGAFALAMLLVLFVAWAVVKLEWYPRQLIIRLFEALSTVRLPAGRSMTVALKNDSPRA